MMESYWIDEQEANYPWAVNPSLSEQEDALDWIKSIGIGAAQGAGTGAAAGPWGALVGGIIGAGLGALQQATQPQSLPQTSSPPRSVPSSAPLQTTPSPTITTGGGGGSAAQQFSQLLPQLIQVIQSIQQIVASMQQSSKPTKEDVEENDFSNEQAVETSEAEDDEPAESPRKQESSWPPILTLQPTLVFSNEWSSEEESAAPTQPVFQWIS